jgi:hypothetical protein
LPKKALIEGGTPDQDYPPKQKAVQKINIDDDDEDLNDRHSARFGGERLMAENSPSPYENDGFEAADLQDDGDDHHGAVNHHHLES